MREALGELLHRIEVPPAHPRYFAEKVIGVLRRAAARNAVARLNAHPDRIGPEVLQKLSETVQGLGLSEARTTEETWPSLLALRDRPELLADPYELAPLLV